jgi:hypothetical protein
VHILLTTRNKYSKLAIIPSGLTKKIQPLDLSVNKSFESKLRSTWERWMMTGVKDCTASGKIKRVSYEEIGRWILVSWQAVTVTCIKKWVLKSFWQYFNTRNRTSRRVKFRK